MAYLYGTLLGSMHWEDYGAWGSKGTSPSVPRKAYVIALSCGLRVYDVSVNWSACERVRVRMDAGVICWRVLTYVVKA